MLTHHYDNARSGVQANESALTPATVNPSSFAKLFSFTTDGDVYAEPLYVSRLAMPDGQQHNVLYVATQHDMVYAFDADGNNPTTGYLWKVSLLASGETWVASTDVGTADITPDIGITGTPVIDRAGATLYVVSKSKLVSGTTTTFIQRLHALGLNDGSEKLNGPTVIEAELPGNADGGATVSFDALRNNQRSALLLAPTPGGSSAASVYIAWASHGDNGVYHGWIIGYNAADISQQTSAYAVTPNGHRGGIWMSGGGLATDGSGTLFAVAGNGDFDADTMGSDYGSSAMALNMAASLTPTSSFTPLNQDTLSKFDSDMGTSAPVLLPDQSGAIPHLLVTADKTGTVYLLNRDAMGGYRSLLNNDVQDFTTGGLQIHNSFAFFNNRLYIAADGGPLLAWTFDPVAGKFDTTPQQSPGIYGCTPCNGSGSTPSVSASGSENGIVWGLDNSSYGKSPAVLHAYRADNVGVELYNSMMAANNRDQAAVAVKFATPTIANGVVYAGGSNAVTAFGLFNVTAGFALASQQPGGDSATVTAGAPAQYTLALTPNVGYRGNISVSCSRAPSKASCTVSPNSVVLAGSSPTSLLVTVTTQGTGIAQAEKSPGFPLAAFCLMGLLLLPSSAGRRLSLKSRRSQVKMLGLGSGILLAASLLGCGGSSSTPPPPSNTTPAGSYTLQVTASDGSNSHVLPLTLVVR